MHQKPRRVYPTSSLRQTGSTLRIVLALLALSATMMASAVALWLYQPLRMKGPAVELAIESGDTPREVAQGWVEAGVDTPAWALYQWFKLSGQSRQIRAGSYELAKGATPRDLLRMMVRGDERLATVRLIEGWTFKRFRAEMAQAPGLKATTAGLKDEEVMAQLGQPGLPAEGQFFPDTYSYAKGSTDLAVMRRAMHAMQKQLDAAWAMRTPTSELKTPEEVLILASIVEKETGREADRKFVSAVFQNRLRIGMPLQTDPTVIYGLGDAFDGNLRRIHLQTDGPFNTYTRAGLPPTPIAMPGKASLMAAVQPADSKALYFVARGDGSSHFSESLNEHNRAVNQYQRQPRPQGSRP
ncbi:MAG: endolytic transglycosylase MltG [Aquabacterium sp.]